MKMAHKLYSMRAAWLGALSERPALSLVQPGGCQRGHQLERGRASIIPSKAVTLRGKWRSF
jgi:hypothetical protein